MVLGGVRPTLEEIGLRFRASKEETLLAIDELISHKVLYENKINDGSISYHPNPASLWELRGPK
jgi:hypothetical protein